MVQLCRGVARKALSAVGAGDRGYLVDGHHNSVWGKLTAAASWRAVYKSSSLQLEGELNIKTTPMRRETSDFEAEKCLC